tara:strand:+ start:1477 stop:2337 length:861 start_codon:yes stop_codon:yes gene_type:complete
MIILSIHCFPHELSELNRLISLLNSNISNVEKESFKFLLHISLNLNKAIIDYTDNEIQASVNEFHKICDTSQIKTKKEVNDKENFLGVNEHRRKTISISRSEDFIMFLDCDIYFNEYLLNEMVNQCSKLRRFVEYLVITASTPKLWDNTWNCLVNNDFKNEELNQYKKISKSIVNNYKGSTIKPIPTFKWAGGWANLISASLLKLIGIPKSFKGYGPDDTFIMECCKILKRKSIKVQQYVLKDFLVIENYDLKSSIKFKKNVPNFREESERHFNDELINFYKKYKN